MRFLALAFLPAFFSATAFAETISLNGDWRVGEKRVYDRTVATPGVATDPAKMNAAPLWYARETTLPQGDWDSAVLMLKGARFDPAVYVNGDLVSRQPGGMAPTVHPLDHDAIRPGSEILLETELQSLADLSTDNASYIPEADHWRSNVSSGLWDDVELHVFKGARIARVIPHADRRKRRIDIRFEVLPTTAPESAPIEATVEIVDATGNVIVSQKAPVAAGGNTVAVSYGNKLALWSPESPTIYQLRVRIDGDAVSDEQTQTFGLKDFKVADKQFELNGARYKVRAGTVVWHRWVRDEEARRLAYDEEWFLENIVLRLKAHGANTLRFHLGNPPERLLDLCDKYGLLVQYEWSFFHGLPASYESLMEQWRAWLDLAMRHPSVALIHPYNETKDDELEIAANALTVLAREYPPFVLKDRDVIHVHKYWWSLFENIGVYYDTADEFAKAVMVDEFGGNYLDGEGEPGGYKTLKEAFLRFLGPGHDAAQRTEQQNLANARVAEYWRRIGAAGFSPFTILSSWEDGNHWFLGPLAEGRPKPVWDELTAAWSPISLSIDLWDRHFTPDATARFPLHLFNDTGKAATLETAVTLEDENGSIRDEVRLKKRVAAHAKRIEEIAISLPNEPGAFTLKAELLSGVDGVTRPIISRWDIRVFAPAVPEALVGRAIGVFDIDLELKSTLQTLGLMVVKADDPLADIVATSRASWEQLASGDDRVRSLLEQVIDRGASVAMLDVGPLLLGEGYLEDRATAFVQSVRQLKDPKQFEFHLFKGLVLHFEETAEPESHIHPYQEDGRLWGGLDKRHGWLWNGLRGGLVVPAVDSKLEGLSREAWLSQWAARGADPQKIRSGPYFAYSLQGYYAFSAKENDAETESALKEKVKFLVQDAPALEHVINPGAPVEQVDLSRIFRESQHGEAQSLTPLISAGKNLTKTPIMSVGFGAGKGRLLISQLIMHGRLDASAKPAGAYGIRYDPVAVQLMLNILAESLNEES